MHVAECYNIKNKQTNNMGNHSVVYVCFSGSESLLDKQLYNLKEMVSECTAQEEKKRALLIQMLPR